MCELEILNNLAVLDDDGNRTTLGTLMAVFLLDPQIRSRIVLSKMLTVNPEFRCDNENINHHCDVVYSQYMAPAEQPV